MTRTSYGYMRSGRYSPSDYDLTFNVEDIPTNIDYIDADNLTRQLSLKTPITRRIHLNLTENQTQTNNEVNVRGYYKFIQDEKVIYDSDNLITSYGEVVFLNRMINDEYPAINNILLGKGTQEPKKLDLQLGNETLRKTANKKFSTQNKTVTLTITVEATDLTNVTEIGTDNGEKLCSHDVFEPILLASDSSITIEYTFSLVSGSTLNNWEQASKEGVYYTSVNDKPLGVSEGESGYHRVNSIDELYKGSYYYNELTQILYIMTISGDNPGKYTIIMRR